MRRLLALFVLSTTAAAAQPSPVQQSVLGFFGVAPHLANERGWFGSTWTLALGQSAETGVFRGLDGIPDALASDTWGAHPQVIMAGRFVGLNAAVQFDLTTAEEPNEDVDYTRSFGVTVRYHSGLNVSGLAAERSPVMVTVGPMLETHIGTVEEIVHADGSEARWGRVGTLQLAPAASVALLGGPVVLHGLVAPYFGGQPWEILNATAGEASGRWDRADPEAPGYDPDLVSARESLGRVDLTGGLYLIGGASLALGPQRAGLGVTVSRTRRDYAVQENGFGVNDAFSETDTRIMFTIGIGLPDPAR